MVSRQKDGNKETSLRTKEAVERRKKLRKWQSTAKQILV